MQHPFDPLDEETWFGGFYEAAVILGPSQAPGADERISRAVLAIWSQPELRVHAQGQRAAWDWNWNATLSDVSVDSHVYGTLSVPHVGDVPVTTLIVREEAGDDWFYLGVPLGGVSQSDGYPFGDPQELVVSRAWREPLEQTLAQLTLKLGEHVPFLRAAIGFEIAGMINTEGSAERRYIGLVEHEGEGYRYLPTTVWF